MNIHNLFATILFFSLGLNAQLYASANSGSHQILDINTFKKLPDYLTLHSELNPQSCLATIDLDNTVFRPEHPALPAGENWFAHRMKEEAAKGENALARVLPEYRKLQRYVAVKPTEESVSPVIKKLQDAGYPVFALTARGPELAVPTERMLKSIGIDFSTTNIPELDSINDLSKGFVHHKGVVHCPGSKGDAVVAIAQHCNLNPAQIIHVDDAEKHVKDVGTKVTKAFPHSCYTGLRYTHCDNLGETFDPHAAQKVIQTWQARYEQHVRR